MEKRNQFTFYRSYYEGVAELHRSKQLKLIMAIVEFGLDGKEPEGLDSSQRSAFRMARPNLLTSRRKAAAGAEGGKVSRCALSHEVSKKKKENKIEIKNEIETETKGFDRFWARYPVHIGKAAAEAAWARACEQQDETLILSRLEDWLSSKTWLEEDGRYIPKAEKWLDETWFLREPAQAVPKGASGKLGEAELEAIQRLLKEE